MPAWPGRSTRPRRSEGRCRGCGADEDAASRRGAWTRRRRGRRRSGCCGEPRERVRFRQPRDSDGNTRGRPPPEIASGSPRGRRREDTPAARRRYCRTNETSVGADGKSICRHQGGGVRWIGRPASGGTRSGCRLGIVGVTRNTTDPQQAGRRSVLLKIRTGLAASSQACGGARCGSAHRPDGMPEALRYGGSSPAGTGGRAARCRCGT